MKREIVHSVGLLSKKGYQLAMDMLAVDGNSDGMTLELDDLSPELVRGLHALVTDSTNHSKRHRHRSRKDRGSSAPAALVIAQTVNLHCGYFNWLDHLSVHPSTRVSDTLCCVRRRLPVGSIVRSVPSSL